MNIFFCLNIKHFNFATSQITHIYRLIFMMEDIVTWVISNKHNKSNHIIVGDHHSVPEWWSNASDFYENLYLSFFKYDHSLISGLVLRIISNII